MTQPFNVFLCRYVKTTANATVDHLSKYLALRIALEDRGGEEGESGGAAGGGECSSLGGISEKQYTIYITTQGGQFSVRTSPSVRALFPRCEVTLDPISSSDAEWLPDPGVGQREVLEGPEASGALLRSHKGATAATSRRTQVSSVHVNSTLIHVKPAKVALLQRDADTASSFMTSLWPLVLDMSLVSMTMWGQPPLIPATASYLE